MANERRIAARDAEWREALRPVIDEDRAQHLGEYECDHGQPISRECRKDCTLNPLRKLIGGKHG